MTAKTKDLIISIAIPLAVGGLSALITKGGMERFAMLEKPPLTPPMIVFPIVWTLLYIMMGIASYIIALSENTSASALKFYAIQLVLNFLWPIFFFGLGWYIFSFAWLVLLWICILWTIKAFWDISKKAACLMLPYLLWAGFALYLNLAVAMMY